MADQRTVTSPVHLQAADPPTPQQLADAIVTPATKSGLVDVTYTGDVSQGAVFTIPLQGFPTQGNSFIVLSNGDVSTTSGTAITFESQIAGGEYIPGTDPRGSPDGLDSYDAVTLSLDFLLPSNPGKLSFDWKFGTEEIPSFNFRYKDYFRADVITTSGFTNIARLPDNTPVTSLNMQPYANLPSGISEAPVRPYPTPDDVTFNSVTTNIAKAIFDLTPYAGQTITLAFRVADVRDGTVNSGAFIDNVRIEGFEICRGIKFLEESD